jgi:hypothetical protein
MKTTTHIQPGIYKLNAHIKSKYAAGGCWKMGTKFSIEKNVIEIGAQEDYIYYSIRQLGHRLKMIRSYESIKWNTFMSFLEPINTEKLSEFSYRLGGIPSDQVLDYLSQAGKINKEDIEEVITNQVNGLGDA